MKGTSPRVPVQIPDSSVFSPPEVLAQYGHYQEILLELQQTLRARANQDRERVDQQVETSPGDSGDASVSDENADYYLALADGDQKRLLETRDALERLRKGTFGVCESCESRIDSERLDRIPYARLCIDCQSARESRHGRRFGISRKL